MPLAWRAARHIGGVTKCPRFHRWSTFSSGLTWRPDLQGLLALPAARTDRHLGFRVDLVALQLGQHVLICQIQPVRMLPVVPGDLDHALNHVAVVDLICQLPPAIEKASFHAMRRFRAIWSRKQRAPEELIHFWLGHAKSSITDDFSKLADDLEFRTKVAEKAGVGFVVRVYEPTPVRPTRPRKSNERTIAVAA